MAVERQTSRQQISDYAVAAVIFLVAVAARKGLDYLIPGQLPFITFFPAVVLTAYVCGLYPAIVVLGLSAVMGSLWFHPVSPMDAPAYRVLVLSLFLGLSGLNVFLVHRLRAANELGRQHEEQLALINRELKHRIKNLFAIAGSICQQTIKSGIPVEAMAKAVSGRIFAIASAQELLSVTSSEGADLGSLVDQLVKPVAPAPDKLTASGPRVVLPANSTTPFALILHELATNALKYGAWSARGMVAVEWTVSGSQLEFRWRERGGPTVAPPIREGLGSTLIKRGLPTGTVKHELHPEGLECRIVVPLPPGH
jgi:two-component sensor histidine kinase